MRRCSNTAHGQMTHMLERRSSKRLAGLENPQGISKQSSRTGSSGSTGITKYLENATLDWNEGAGAPAAASSSEMTGRAMTFRKKAAAKEPKLPRNWKKSKKKDGTVYYINTVTQRTCHEPPPELPKGWREALHKDSEKVYYYHKTTRQSTFKCPTTESPTTESATQDDDDADDNEPLPAPEGLMSRTITMMRGKKDKDGISRTSTLTGAMMSFRGSKAKAKVEEKQAAEDAGAQKTVFISCSTLIKEVKLCVEQKHQQGLDSLYEKLTLHRLPAEQAVKQLMEMVGSTVVQQAGLSVMNFQKGTLPHGWLEYIDEASSRPYYYNVHKKLTTWYKPAEGNAAVAPPPAPEKATSADAIGVSMSLETHNVAMTGFI